MNKLMLTLFVAVLSACSTGKKGVNEPKVQPPPYVFGVIPMQDKYSATGNKEPAIAGKVVLSSQMQRPLAGVNVGIFKQQAGDWKHIMDFSTNMDGTFSVNKALETGEYELRIQSAKYEGKLNLSLTQPFLDLVIEASQKK